MKFFIGIFSFIFTINAWAVDVPNHSGFVTDKADIFSNQEEKLLTAEIKKIEKNTTAEIAVLSIKTTNDVPIFDYAMAAAETWGVGEKDTDNGLFILIAVDDRKYQILTGYGLEGVLPDGRIDQISRKNFTPNFRQNLYYNGVSNTLSDIGGFLIQDPTIVSKYSHTDVSDLPNKISAAIFVGIILLFILNAFEIFNNKKQPERTAIVSSIFGIFVWILVGSLIAGIIAGFFIFILGNLRGTGGKSSSSNDGFGNSTFSGGSFGGFGSSSSSSSSSSSFGGGSFGGGGSSGSW